MILFGAGASVPFDIPGMAGFTEQFIKTTEKSMLITDIENGSSESEKFVGISLSFDLETLLSVLTDLSGTVKKPISVPTMALLLKQSLDIKKAQEKYGKEASSMLNNLREFIFKMCMQPIERGKKEGNFKFLDRFYGPLLTILNKGDLANVQHSIQKIYSVNWDLCFKTWVDYINISINDGIDIDKQSNPVLKVENFNKPGSDLTYVPLHGSLDLVKMSRPKGSGIYEDIFKISDPIGYFKDKTENINKVFMIYPLEAIGYEESTKSPYLDMLTDFKSSLRGEEYIFIIGYSLRDPTIGSVFEEVIGERIRKGDLKPLSKEFKSRKSEASQNRMKIIAISPDPNKLVENLKKQSSNNLLQTFVPLKIEFPKTTDADFDIKYVDVLTQLREDLRQIGYLGDASSTSVSDILNTKYGLELPKVALDL